MSSKGRRPGSGSQSSNPPKSKHAKVSQAVEAIERKGTQGDIESAVVRTVDADMDGHGDTPNAPASPASSPSSRSSSPIPPIVEPTEPPSAVGDEMLDKLFKMLSTKIEKEAKSTKEEISGLRHEFKGELKKVSKKQDAMDLRITDCTSRVSALETAISNAENIAKEAKLEKADIQDKLAQVLDVSASKTGGAPVSLPSSSNAASSAGLSNFCKPGRPNAITINLEGLVHFSRTACKDFFTNLLQVKGLACDIQVAGLYETSKRFVVLFNGPGNVGTECVNCLLRARKDEEGKWVPHTIKTPSNDSVRVYFDLEKSHKQVKLETITNNFSKMLCERYGEKWCFARKDQGKILKEGVPMVQISVSENSSSMQWFRRFINTAPDFKDNVDKLFHESFGEELCP